MRIVIILAALCGVSACASLSPATGELSSYEGMKSDGNAVRAKVAVASDRDALAAVRRVRIAPARMASAGSGWMTPNELLLTLREVDAQMCFELTERYELAAADDRSAHEVRTVIAAVEPTGQAGSAAAAAASFFIPGPVGVRAPTGRGGLAAESELVNPQGVQLAAITWSRRATVVGMDNPSLSRVGDALQFAEPFADAAAAAMTTRPAPKSRRLPKPDPCAAYGPRVRPEGWLASFATGLYVPQMSGASQARKAAP